MTPRVQVMGPGFFSDRRRAVFLLLCFTLLAFLLSGCAGLVRMEQGVVTGSVPLSEDVRVGQTFVAKYAGLSGIYFFLTPAEGSAGAQVRLHLRASPQSTADLAVSQNTVTLGEADSTAYYGFFIPPQADSNRKYYYAELEYTGPGSILVGTGPADAYLNGALQQQGDPAEAQSAFQLSYSRRAAFLGLGMEALSWLGILAAAVFLYVLPGWGIFSLLWRGWAGLRWAEKLGLSAGLSLAIYPLLLLWTGVVGLHLGAVYAWLPPLAGILMLLWSNRRALLLLRGKKPSLAFLRRLSLSDVLPDLTLLAILALVIGVRFWVIRSLEAPLALDTYQHTLIPQLMLDHGGLFTSWQPYADLVTFTYHFGFHAAAAVFTWLTRLDLVRAVMLVGQLVNILAVIALYPLALKISRSKWAGVGAVLVAGLLSSMPMFYTNWGRYPQLAGQVILPAAVWLLWDLHTTWLEQPVRSSWKNIAVAALALAGLALTHYRVLLLALMFLPVLWMLYARRKNLRAFFLKTFWAGAAALALFLPWFIRVFGGRIMSMFAARLALPAASAGEVDAPHSGATGLAFYMPYILWVALALVVILGGWLRSRSAALVTLWWSANLLASFPAWLGLGGAGIISGDTYAMATYIPAALLLGGAVGWLEEWGISAHLRRPLFRQAALLLLAALLLFAGVKNLRLRQKDVAPPGYIMVTRPDVRAYAWIRENTPASARFLVNSFAIFKNTSITGSDGGFWIPLLARRADTVPPLMYGFEARPWADYASYIMEPTLQIRAKGILDPSVLALLQSRGITHVYIGQRGGIIGGGSPLLNAGELLSDPHFKLVYHQDRVWIFAFNAAGE